MNIVVVVPGGLTETLQAAPLLAALSNGTGERLLVVGPPSAVPLTRRLVGADEVVGVAGLHTSPTVAGLARLWEALRGRRLDIAIVCSASAAVRATVYLAGVPRRLGVGTGLSDRLLTDTVASPADGNLALAWAGLCAPLRIPARTVGHSYLPAEPAVDAAERLLLNEKIGDGRLLVAVAPGTGFADGRVAGWTAERYAHLANRLASRHGAGIVLVGDERDRAVADTMRIDLAAESLDLCGEIDLGTTAAVLSRCDLLVGADIPLLHLAAAVGTPSVGLFGPTDGRTRAPAGAEHRVVQALPNGTSHGSLERIRVDDVLAGIESAL